MWSRVYGLGSLVLVMWTRAKDLGYRVLGYGGTGYWTLRVWFRSHDLGLVGITFLTLYTRLTRVMVSSSCHQREGGITVSMKGNI